ncbi:hypothetical protein NQ315_003509 [Exocentrus adspersus]|uniref:C2H2-type domain-containing protein n=1 Tax=Exocentrus adspersus TaxID=1586481 RepID=A0AAV8V5C0_9CUCU|nr:hypothetical protein NQ315_003509 [Exocentrus adspersus]
MYGIKKFRELKTRKKGTNESKIMCVLCCNTCSKKALEDTEELVKEVLDVVLLETNLTTTKRSVMCLKCSQRVNNIFEFKSGCLYVEDFVTPFVSTEEGKQIDLKEVYIKEKGNKDLIDALLGRDLCRLCLSVVDNECVYLDSSDLHVTFIKDMIKRCIPEINVNNTKNAIICGTCVSCLKDYYNFMESYSESGSTSHSQTTGRSMKDESELTYLPANRSASSHTSRTASTPSKRACPLGREISSQMYRCDFCDYKSKLKCRVTSHVMLTHKKSFTKSVTRQKANLKRHMLIHWFNTKFNCNLCNFKTKYKESLQRHMLIHRNPLEIEWFECHLCDFKAKRKHSLKTHNISSHKDPSEIEWFECHLCNFKAKLERNLKIHMLIHKNSSEIEWFKCDLCDYKAKHKHSLKRHNIFNHKDPSKIEWFECDLCDFKAKYKGNLKTHTLIHKNPSEIGWLKCHLCNFKAKLKGNLKVHTLIHKNSSEIEWFKCHLCDYKAKHKYSLKTHNIVHKDPSEIEWFECHLCNFKAKLKSNLQKHMLIHKNPSEIEWFECDSCDFKAKRKDSSEIIEWFECRLCDFKAKQKSDLRRHTLIHKFPSEIEWFDLCDFKAKRKLISHTLIYKNS